MFTQGYGTVYYAKRFPMTMEKSMLVSLDPATTVSKVLTQIIYLSVFAAGQTVIRNKTAIRNLLSLGESSIAIKRSVRQMISVTCTVVLTVSKRAEKALRVIGVLAMKVHKRVEKVSRVGGNLIIGIKKYKEYKLEFTGAFAPGDEIKINTKTMQVTLNSVNALNLVEGTFPILSPGTQKLVYTDSSGTRRMSITVQWRDKWL